MEPITAALIAGGAAIAGQAAGQGIGWLAGGGRKAKKAQEEELADAEKAVRRGRRRGWGPSVGQKNKMVALVRKDIDSAFQADKQEADRREAAQGFGRSGLNEGRSAEMARAKANAVAQARTNVETAARQEGMMKRAAALDRRSAARAQQYARAQRAAQVGAQMGGAAMQSGAQMYSQQAALKEQRRMNDITSAFLGGDAGRGTEPNMSQRDMRKAQGEYHKNGG